MDFALNNLQRLICYKTQTTNELTNLRKQELNCTEYCSSRIMNLAVNNPRILIFHLTKKLKGVGEMVKAWLII